MIKKLLFTTALVVPSIAYAANPTATFSDQVVPAGSDPIACDIGPSYTGSIPEPAQAMGYTHCAANYNFTNSYFTTVSNWLACTDDGTTFYLFWLEQAGAGSVPCSRVSMINDGGTQTLDLTFTPTDFNNNAKTLSLQSTSGKNLPTPVGTLFPNGMYVDQVYRLPQSTYNSVASADPDGVNFGGIWTYGVGLFASPQTNIMEWDFGEMYGGNSPYQSSNVGEHCGDSTGGFNCKFGQLYYTSRTAGWELDDVPPLRLSWRGRYSGALRRVLVSRWPCSIL